MTLIKTEFCSDCQNETEVYEIEIVGGEHKGETMEWKKGCRCEEIQMANEELKKRNHLKQEKMKKVFDRHSLINRDLQNACFENYQPDNHRQDYAKRTAERYVEVFDIDDSKNLLMHGIYGVGKSHLAKAIADGVMEKGYSSIFISVPKMLRKIKSTYNKDSEVNEDEILTVLEDVDLLILDDIGTEKRTDWTSERIYDIIDSRQGKHTIYTTNLSPDELKTELGERNFSRVQNRDTSVLKIDGENNRLKDSREG